MLDAMTKTEEPKSNDTKAASPSSLNPPNIDSQGRPTTKAIGDAKQAHAIAKEIYNRGKEGRLKTAGVISRKYNGESPFQESALRAASQGWRNNFSTLFLASIIDRVTPQFKDPISRAEVIDHSQLDEKFDDASKKSRAFCLQTSKTIRSWPGWSDFLSLLTQEVALYGVASPMWLDDDWRPAMPRFDEALFPEGTGQHASKVQVAVFSQQIMLHDFIQKLEDTEAAKLAGYNIEECAKAANTAAHRDGERAEASELEKADAIREAGALGASHIGRVKTVNVWHVLVREYKGGVALWTVEQEGEGREIRHVEKIHETMEDALTLFTLQTGSGKYYGSKGLGRMLVNLHTSIERMRCLGADQAYLSGLLVLTADSKDFNRIQPAVRHPFIVLPKECEVSKEQITFNATEHKIVLDDLIATAESISGAFIPPNIDNQGSSRTKIEAAQKAEREMAVKAGVLGRFFAQFSELISGMKRKIYSPENIKEGKRIFDEKISMKKPGVVILARKVWAWIKGIGKDRQEPPKETVICDTEAVSAVVSLLEDGLSVEEIATLALSPSGSNTQDSSEARDQATTAFLQANAVNPYIDQRESTLLQAQINIGADRANRVVIPDKPDTNVQAIATRDQIIEFSEMLDGNAMPVASTDNHKIHRMVLAGLMQPKIGLVEQDPTPEMIQAMTLSCDHYEAHVMADQQTEEGQKKQELETVAQLRQVIEGAAKAMQQAAEQQQAQPGQLPAPVGQPGMSVGPDGQLIGAPPQGDEAKMMMEGLTKAAELKAVNKELELREHEIELERAKHDHKVGMDAAGLASQGADAVRSAAMADRDAQIKVAEAERANEIKRTER